MVNQKPLFNLIKKGCFNLYFYCNFAGFKVHFILPMHISIQLALLVFFEITRFIHANFPSHSGGISIIASKLIK
ncbi:MAG: hypothetical protein EA393_14045 [Bacteroidetes bacterium]|nr:MAG: hypothetical protein EA393_14045 [Bacteroidota bacterium]